MNFLKTILPALGASASALLSDCTGKPAAAGAPGEAATTPSPAQELFDTTRLKGEMNEILQGVTTGHPDTAKLKEAGADVLSTAAAVLSDTGISKLYGNDHDPSVQAAKDMLIRLRDSIGLNAQKLDEVKKAAEQLRSGGH
ncbi:MAG TPA: hypothetical protein VHD83_26945 [Puia sp.]|nr:hypothetical protein [Puia sp.]